MSNLTNELSRVLDQAGDDLCRDAAGVELAEKVHGPITELVLTHDFVVDGKPLFVEGKVSIWSFECLVDSFGSADVTIGNR